MIINQSEFTILSKICNKHQIHLKKKEIVETLVVPRNKGEFILQFLLNLHTHQDKFQKTHIWILSYMKL